MSDTSITLPAKLYHDHAIYDQEKENIFKKSWLLYAHSSQFKNAGDYLAKTIAGYPLFLIKAKDGAINGFHNVCRHRASMVLNEGMGKAGAIRCMYHGWMYNDKGALKKAPHFGNGEEALCKNTSLFPVHIKIWNDLIFISLDERPSDFDEALGDLPKAFKDIDLSEYHFHSMHEHLIKCNWKAYVENYAEGYHIPLVHKELNKQIEFNSYKVTPYNKIALHEANPSDKAGPNQGVWLWHYPYASLNLYQNGLNLETMVPISNNKTRLDYYYLFKNGTSEEEINKTVELSRLVTEEDIKICEIVQKNLEAGIYETGRLSPNHEKAVSYFQDLIRKDLGLNG
jgi:choline monooxygenase